jgi:hypothetical protein
VRKRKLFVTKMFACTVLVTDVVVILYALLIQCVLKGGEAHGILAETLPSEDNVQDHGEAES